MGATNAGHILRLRFDPDTASANPPSAERLLQGEVGQIRVVAMSAQGGTKRGAALVTHRPV
jgi:hypothetical protein